MRAALMRAFGEPLGVETVADPAPPADGVVAVRATDVCRSDRHGWMWRVTSWPPWVRSRSAG